MLINENIIFYLMAYLIGAIPFGFLITKYIYKVDIRTIGSGSIGATNVYRVLKNITPSAKKVSVITILLDSTKGLIVVLLAKIFSLSYETQWVIVILSVLGHCYSPYLGFKGGKGVSTTIGSVLLLIPIEGIFGLIIWFIVGRVFKVSSLSSLIGVSCGILLSFVLPQIHPSISVVGQIGTNAPLFILLVIIIYTHIPNIIRLIKKEESMIF